MISVPSVNQCPKLYFINPELSIILYTHASDYAYGAYLCQVQTQPDGSLAEQPIRFLSGIFAGAQTRWSIIEKEAHAIYWALNFFDDLTWKVLQWKLDIQHYDSVIEHIPGEKNIPADVFSRLVPKPTNAILIQILVLQCTDTQRALIKENHE